MADATCSFPDCEEPSNGSRGWCYKHYRRWQRHGDPAATPRFNRDPADRFWTYVEVGHPAGCWWWTGKINNRGYGQFVLGRRVLGDRRSAIAHRFAYESLVALIPPDLQVDHLCRNRRCVNPDHLEIVTPGENTRRGAPAHKTHCKHGHPLSGTNVYIQASTGRRSCLTCRRANYRRYREADVLELAAELSAGPDDDGAGGEAD